VSRSTVDVKGTGTGVRTVPVASVARILGRSARLQIREFLGRPLAVVVAVVQPAAFVLLVLFAAPDQPPDVEAARVAGVGLLGVWATSVWSAGMMLAQDRWEGTLAAVLFTARQPFTVLIGRSFGGALAGVAAILASIVTTLASIGELGGPTSLALLLLLPLAVLSATAIGTLVATLFIRSRSADRIAEVVLYPVFVCSGVLLPLRMFPAWLRPVSWVLPLYWADRVLRSGSAGRLALGAVVVLVAMSAAYTLAGAWIFRRVVATGRERGNLDFT
jgi:ABC-2 type transport system permease protein